MNELIRELVEALEKNHQWHQDYDDYGGYPDSELENKNSAALAKARAYLETGGWTRVEDGLPVVPDGKKSVAIYVVSNGLVLKTHGTEACSLGGLVGVTHWRYAEPTPEPPRG